ncbi:MAG: 2-oxoglutarate dehydrogenase complex dihydrolipoyllysine-residue succinyltransferase [Pseudomonadota bacterium]
MQVEIKIPSVGESIREATIAQWFKKEGAYVKKDEPLFVIETDKVTLEIVAPADGILAITVPEGKIAAIGAVVGVIDTEGGVVVPEKKVENNKPAPAEKTVPAVASTSLPSPAPPVPVATSSLPHAPLVPVADSAVSDSDSASKKSILSPSVRRLVAEKRLDAGKIQGTGPGGRLTKGDVILFLESAAGGQIERNPAPVAIVPDSPIPSPAAEGITRKPMSRIRKRIAERLVAAKQSTAMLTTFNEIDMSRPMEIRARYKEAFNEAHGVRLGFMSFFTKACVAALEEFPELNAFIDGDDIVYHHAVHMGMAIGSERGLLVPVIRNAHKLSFAAIEKSIIEYVDKIKHNQLALEDLEGGTFTITNGGVYGSLLSTPILNMPQSGILGLHKIEKRPVVVADAIVIRPMMYVALSYDHRIVDGKEAVSFLKRIKTDMEEPERWMLEV